MFWFLLVDFELLNTVWVEASVINDLKTFPRTASAKSILRSNYEGLGSICNRETMEVCVERVFNAAVFVNQSEDDVSW